MGARENRANIHESPAFAAADPSPAAKVRMMRARVGRDPLRGNGMADRTALPKKALDSLHARAACSCPPGPNPGPFIRWRT